LPHFLIALQLLMPASKRKRVLSAPATPQKLKSNLSTEIADRSARRKSARQIIEKRVASPVSDEDLSDEGDVAQEVWGRDEADDEPDDDGLDEEEIDVQETPSKTKARKARKGASNRTPSPPPKDLPPHERYFWDNRMGANKTSNNTLPPHLLLNHDEFFLQQEAYEDQHAEEQASLMELHESSFPQWDFELKNGFNICLYGYGSKRALTGSFAEYLYGLSNPPPKIVIVNGYNASITLQDILTTIAGALLPAHLKLPSVASTLLTLVLETLETKAPETPIYLLVNSIDAAALRRQAIHTALATLAPHPKIRLLASADTPNFPLLWNISLRSKFRFVFHDCTTFKPFIPEIDAVESVNELLGRSGRRLGGRDGIGYVLRSLPENARHLFRILVAEQVAAAADDVEAADQDAGGKSRITSAEGVEYRLLYHKAREELVCSTEHQLRTLLKEFYDHQMVESKRDATGTERLLVPFRREELESLLEELVE
jgi:origin recognition complex subunit 2